jgi:flagellar assembly factor FliW
MVNLALKCETSETTRFWTSRFGVVEAAPDSVIDLPEGLIGFERCRRFLVVSPDENSPLKWFQCLDDGTIAFPIVDPRELTPDYAPTISEGDAQELGLTPDTPKIVFAIVTIPKGDPRGLTANLLGPIVANSATRRGRQVIVADEQYGTRHPIL